MRIKDQIRSRREALGMEMAQLAKRVGVTEQAVRHWESGRSFPGKSKMRLVEEALSFTLDWTEGAVPAGAENKTAAALVDQGDIDLLLVIARLPKPAKNVIGEFARMHLEAVERARTGSSQPDNGRGDAGDPAPIKASPARKAVTAGRG